MLYKNRVINDLDNIINTLEGVDNAFQKHAVDPVTLYQQLKRIREKLETIRTLVGNEREG
jgi:hypothetical protein